MIRTLLLAWTIVVAIAPGAVADECRHEHRSDSVLYHHPTGFALNLASSLRVDCREVVMRVTDPAQPERTSGAAIVRLVSDEPPGRWPEAYGSDNGGPFRYRVDRLNGGSGGTEYTVSAWRSLPTASPPRFVLVEQHRQFELEAPGRHAWSLAWTILSNAQLSPAVVGE